MIALGVTIDPAPGFTRRAAELERLGYSSLWINGGRLSRLELIAELLDATATARVGTAIIPAEIHPPDDVTAVFAGAEARHPGRFVAGLGAPQTGERPMRQLERYLDRLDAAEPPVPPDRRILAALGPRKLELAARRFAGAITLLVTPDYTAWARTRLGDHATLVTELMVVPDAGPRRARSAGRDALTFLLGVAGYRANALRMGFTDAEIDGLADRLVDELIAWGDDAAIAARVRDHLDAGADEVVLNLLTDDAAQLPVAGRLAALLT
jgi:probable F420-dependent oxidoreductase